MTDHFNTVAEKAKRLVRDKMMEEYGPGPQKAWEKQEAKEREIQENHDAKETMRKLMEDEYGTGPEQAWKRQERKEQAQNRARELMRDTYGPGPEEAWKRQERIDNEVEEAGATVRKLMRDQYGPGPEEAWKKQEFAIQGERYEGRIYRVGECGGEAFGLSFAQWRGADGS